MLKMAVDINHTPYYRATRSPDSRPPRFRPFPRRVAFVSLAVFRAASSRARVSARRRLHLFPKACLADSYRRPCAYARLARGIAEPSIVPASSGNGRDRDGVRDLAIESRRRSDEFRVAAAEIVR